MNTPEIQRIRERGVLAVGVRDDMPLFAEGGEGFEIELAQKFAAYLLPDTAGDAAAKLITVNGKTASTKLSDGTIDAAVALMPRGASSKYVYSYPYYTDTCSVLVKSGSETTPLNELVIGFVQGTAGETRLKKYIDAHETKLNALSLTGLRDAHRNFPPMQSCSQQKLSPPIRSFSMRLRAAPLPVRPSPVLTAQDMRKIYLHTDLSAMKQVSAMSNMQSPQLRMNPPLLSLRNCSSMTCKKAVSLMHCLKNTDFDSSP